MKKKILIMGATGFIGKNLVDYYTTRSEYQVFCTYNKRPAFEAKGAEWIHANLTVSEDVFRAVNGMDIIVQAAATTSGAADIVNRPYIHTTDNAVMNSLIFRAAFESKVSHVIFFSCTVMYNSSATAIKETNFDANAEMHKNYFGVGWTKVYLEKMAEFYSKLGTTKFTVLRHSNVYGPHDKFDLERSHVFGATVTKVMTAKDGKIVVWGTGEAERDLIYTSDLNDAVDLSIQKQTQPYGLYNVGYGKAVSVKDLVFKIIQGSQKDIQMEHDLSKPAIYTKVCLDCSKIEKDFGWKPKVDLETGIKKTIEWYKANVTA